MLERFWDCFVDTLKALFLPLVSSYFAISSSVFLSISAPDAKGLEWLANQLLSPVHYILAGTTATQDEQGSWTFEQKFDYKSHFWLKTGSSLLALPPSLVLGSTVKALSLLGPQARSRYLSLISAVQSTKTQSQVELYRQWGLAIGVSSEPFYSQGCLRRPGDEKVLSAEKEALQEIAALLNEAQIPWWVDCGSCLGAYRYGGVIPWDEDVDIAVLAPDFENVMHALNRLDRNKYMVQNWSSRSFPKSLIKVVLRKTGNIVDIYHFAISPETRELHFIFALDEHLFFPEWLKIRERRFKAPVAFETVFPLKRAYFDGVEVFVPNNPQRYLQRYYGENLAPAKVYNPLTGVYEKDLTHPYWQRQYVH